MEVLKSGDTLGSLYWAQVCRPCSQPAGHLRFRTPLDQNTLGPEQPMQQMTGVIGRNKQATVTHSDRMSSSDNNVSTKTLIGEKKWLAGSLFAFTEQASQIAKIV